MSQTKSNFWKNLPLRDYEFRSEAEFFGFPLVHIVHGLNQETGRLRIARGIIAIGDIAIGIFALGGISFGILAFGGISLACYAIGGIAIGGTAVGGISLGICTAIGVIAVAPGTAYGLLTFTPQLNAFTTKIAQLIFK